MAKKKQLAGKETKLARLPLTRALARQEGAGEFLGPPAASLPALDARQLPLSWEDLGEGAGGALAAAYLETLTDLANLKQDLGAKRDPALSNSPPLPEAIPPARSLHQALRQAQKGLQALHRILSGS
jgi:hypothetical protein